MIAVKHLNGIRDRVSVPEGFHPVNVLSWHKEDTPYFNLSPYFLKTEKGYLFENWWQGSKIYPRVFNNIVHPHKNLSHIVWWKYECENGSTSELHLDENDEILPRYFVWRKSIWENKFPVRYPNRFENRHTCKYFLKPINENEFEALGYGEARKEYLEKYKSLAKNLSTFKTLKRKVEEKTNICILEIDVPSPKRQANYLNADGVYEASLETLKKLFEDLDYPFGHGLCLAWCLLDEMNN